MSGNGHKRRLRRSEFDAQVRNILKAEIGLYHQKPETAVLLAAPFENVVNVENKLTAPVIAIRVGSDQPDAVNGIVVEGGVMMSRFRNIVCDRDTRSPT